MSGNDPDPAPGTFADNGSRHREAPAAVPRGSRLRWLERFFPGARCPQNPRRLRTTRLALRVAVRSLSRQGSASPHPSWTLRPPGLRRATGIAPKKKKHQSRGPSPAPQGLISASRTGRGQWVASCQAELSKQNRVPHPALRREYSATSRSCASFSGPPCPLVSVPPLILSPCLGRTRGALARGARAPRPIVPCAASPAPPMLSSGARPRESW